MKNFLGNGPYATTYQRGDYYSVIVAATNEILLDNIELYTEAEQLAERINELPDGQH